MSYAGTRVVRIAVLSVTQQTDRGPRRWQACRARRDRVLVSSHAEELSIQAHCRAACGDLLVDVLSRVSNQQVVFDAATVNAIARWRRPILGGRQSMLVQES